MGLPVGSDGGLHRRSAFQNPSSQHIPGDHLGWPRPAASPPSRSDGLCPPGHPAICPALPSSASCIPASISTSPHAPPQGSHWALTGLRKIRKALARLPGRLEEVFPAPPEKELYSSLWAVLSLWTPPDPLPGTFFRVTGSLRPSCHLPRAALHGLFLVCGECQCWPAQVGASCNCLQPNPPAALL